MKLHPESVEKPLKKLRKQLKRFPSSPPPEQVHSLRTRTRRLEATVTALSLDKQKQSRRLLKLIKPVRKSAGKVRDMDVLVGDTLTLSETKGSDAVVRLVEHLAKMRVRNARKLRDVVTSKESRIRESLKQASTVMRERLKDSSARVECESAPRILITELSHWPDLREDNLHLFRIRIKELRYMLQLSPESDERLVKILGQVKDLVGDWHDWVELLRIARQVLDPRIDRVVLADIESIRNEKLRVALAAANRVRQRYFGGRKAARNIPPAAS